MSVARSPFLIYQQFISPLQCEEIVSDLRFFEPDIDVDGNPQKMFRHSEKHEEDLYIRTQEIIPEVFGHYECEYKGTERMMFEYLAQGVETAPECGNSEFVNNQWLRIRDRDLTGFLFLSDHNDHSSFDVDYEVYGGKLEFPQHGFSLNPERGTLVIFPSLPHFVYANSPILAGDLFQVKLNFAAKQPYMYDPKKFPGDYRSWFVGLK